MSKKLEALGLALIALCAFGAVSASAQAAVHWNVNGAALGAGVSESVSETVTLTKIESEPTPEVTLTVSGLYRIQCSSLKIKEGKITGPELDSAASLVFSGCVVLTTAGAATTCTVEDTGAGNVIGTIRTNATKTHLIAKTIGGVQHAYDIFEPTTGTSFVQIVIAAQSGKTCALSGTNSLAGSASVEPQTGTNATLLEGTASATVATNAGTALTYGARAAIIDGTGDASLSSGKTWGVSF
jgi:hypothetical protein